MTNVNIDSPNYVFSIFHGPSMFSCYGPLYRRAVLRFAMLLGFVSTMPSLCTVLNI